MELKEQARLEALWAYDILDTPAEEDFDEIVELASKICGVPISLITLIDQRREFRKAMVGITGQNNPREYTFCTHAIEQDDIMIVEDATKDERFKSNPFVLDAPDIRFYAGMPLRTPSGFNLGTLCVIDVVPQSLNETQKYALRILSRQVINNLEMRLKVKQLKAALKTVDEQSQKLATLNRNNTRLLSIVGHDVRNPLAGIKSVLNLVKEGMVEPDEFESLSGDLETQVDYAIDLLNNLVEWGVSGRKGTIDKRSIDLSYIIRDIARMQTPAAKAKGLTLVPDVSDGLRINADEDMIRFVIRNLVQNSIKFTESGQITLFARDSESGTVIKVTDTGRGMSDDVKNRLFNWATRSTEKGTSGEAGSGLGLIMCKEFVDAHGGDIQVQSDLGTGSEFSIRIPS
jgi:signal transduction histidine kinase